MREITPIERVLFTIDRFERELKLMRAEVESYLPDDGGRKPRDWIRDPITGKRRHFKKKKI